MMKIFKIGLLLFIIGFVASSCGKVGQEQETYQIEGYVTGFFEGTAVLYKFENGTLVPEDSVYIKKSKFVFKKHRTEYPQMMFLVFGNRQAMIEIFVENTAMRLNADIGETQKAEISGSESHAIYAKFLENNSVYENRIQAIDAQLLDPAIASNSAQYEQLTAERNNSLTKQLDFTRKFVSENADSYAAAYIALQNLAHNLSPDKLSQIIEQFSAEVKLSNDYARLKKIIEIKRNLENGKQAPDFTLNDIHDQAHSLVSQQGKTTLLYFWASWCGPCRADNPTLRKIYENQSTSKFEIMGVSLDTHRSGLENVIKTDKITWLQVSDLKGKNSDIAKLYNIQKIPYYILLDEKGIIKAQSDDLEDIQTKISK